jgi:hypothetical protein
MNENMDADNKNTEIQDEEKLPDSNNDLIKTDNSLPGAVDQYRKILEQRDKRQSTSGNLGAAIVCILVFLMVLFNIYSVETQKYELNILRIQKEQLAKEKQAEIDKIKLQIAQKNKESADLVIFNDKYLPIRTDYYSKIKAITVKAENKLASLDDIIKITEERINLSKEYKNKLNMIAIPAQMADFQKYETEFLDSDINLWTIVNAYYSLNDLTKFDTNKIYEESEKSHELFLRAQDEIKNIYTENGLSYFLKDIIMNY